MDNYNELDLVLDILNEEVNIENLKSYAENFYSHLIKWKYQPTRRRVSLINTIIDNSRRIYKDLYDTKKKKMNTNKVNKLNGELYSVYQDSFEYALGEMRDLKNKPKFEDEIYYLFPTVEAIINEDAVRAYIKQGATQAVIDQIDGKRR